jgi:hypothetical protein
LSGGSQSEGEGKEQREYIFFGRFHSQNLCSLFKIYANVRFLFRICKQTPKSLSFIKVGSKKI